ncbi:restriction endonuclease subunit S [Acuticoccus kandeliae]|uniref:restriction endonuclease subunit S n=1 Tax=Acuticoccus kandeliae TaxID=2073160 RepID=UPI000D3E3085|nr:restriction endonuclease subunit S [Acuticoccus kandeliae]
MFAQWHERTLNELVTLQRGFDITKAEQRDGPYPVISSSGVKSTHAEYKVEGPGVIIGRKGSLGTVFYSATPFWPHDTTLWVKAFHGNDPRFCFYFLKTMGFEQYDVGASNPTLNRNHVHGLPVRIPPLDVQRRIAGILSAYDDLIENNTRRIAILEEMARRLYEEWFVHFRFPGHESTPILDTRNGPLPEGWERCKVSEAAEYVNRGIAPKYAENGPSLVINQKCIRDQRLSLGPARRQQRAIPDAKQVCLGDVLINSTGVGTLGRVAQVWEELPETTVDTHVTIVRPRADVDHWYFGAALLALQPFFEDAGVGSTGQTELSRTRIGEVDIVVPQRNIQMTFAANVERNRLACINLAKQNANLRAQRDLLLPKLISGEIDVAATEEALPVAAE